MSPSDFPTVALLTLGGLMLLIGLGGGGIAIHALKIERVEPSVRLLSGFLGAGALVLGLMQVPSLCVWPQACVRAGTTSPPPSPPTSEGVRILVQSELFDGELSERVSLTIDGLPWGEIVLDHEHPQGLLRIGLPGAVKLRYSMDFQNTVDFDGTVRALRGAADGTLDVRDGQVYRVRCQRRDDDSYRVWLERVASST